MSRPPNRLQRVLNPIEKLPGPVRTKARSMAIGKVVPFVGTADLVCEALGPDGGVFTIANKKKVQNHISGVHAAAMALLAETATGLTLGVHVPDDKLPLLKSMHIDYVKRAQGDLRAEAKLTLEQIERVHTEPKGSVNVAVTVTDESGSEPIKCEMIWAWIPKKKKKD